MNRFYLDEVNHPERFLDDNDSREPKWAEEREEYGFDERETWALDNTFYCWLYERLRAYQDWSCVNLDFHKFEYKGKEYTQGQLIAEMIVRLRWYFENEEENLSWTDKDYEFVHEIEQIWALVLPSMWW